MSVLARVRGWVSYSRRSSGRRSPRYRPQLGRLEDRCMLSVASTTPIAQQIAATVAGGQTLPAKHDNVVLDWNATMLEAIWTDGTQPTVATRTMAMVQVAVYDAVDAIQPQYALYPIPGFKPHAPAHASVDAAAAAAADQVLVNIYPDQAALFSAQLQSSLADVPNGPAKTAGIAFGQSVANAVLAWRSHDGSNAPSNYQPAAPGTDPGTYELTPPNYPAPISPQWGGVTPFAEKSATQFMPTAPPALTSLDYAADYDITEALGGTTSTLRTPDQTQMAHFWADVAGKSVTPPGHWNEIAEQTTLRAGLNVVQSARVFALLDMGLADAAITCWDAKYLYNTWRPVTAIEYADLDGNPLTVADPGWTPLWNSPAFPEYTSGHSTFSGAAASILTALFGDRVAFTIGSDDMPGYTRTFTSFDQAADEAGLSRVVGGIHFMTANLNGLKCGQEIGQYTVDKYLGALNGHNQRVLPAASNLHLSNPVRGGIGPISHQAAWAEAWQLATAIVEESGASMTPWQRWELTLIIAAKLEIPISQLGSLDFSLPCH